MEKILENNIIKLRAPEPEDLDIMYRWENDTSLWEYGSSLTPYSRFALKKYLIDSKQDLYSDKQLRMMVVLKKTNLPIGTVDLYDFDPYHRRAGVGILIDTEFRQEGYGLQALDLLDKYAFDFLNFHQLYAFIPESNIGSLELFKKADYIRSGLLNDWLSQGSIFTNVVIMQKINTMGYAARY